MQIETFNNLILQIPMIDGMYNYRSLHGRCFLGFVHPVFEYCSAVWCSAADTHLKLLDRVVSGARFLTGDAFECDIAHRRSVSILCMLYKIKCNSVHPLYLDRMCQCRLHPVLSSNIGSLMLLLAAEPRSTAGRLFASQCPSVTILLTLY